VVGDGHIPHRAAEIPEKFQKMLVPNRIQHVVCTGNMITKEQYEELRALAPNVHAVCGDMEQVWCSMAGRRVDVVTRGMNMQHAQLPEYKVITIGQFRFGVCHGHQVVPCSDQASLSALQRKV
jgi:vacuolar protein sorting-associated protein 29